MNIKDALRMAALGVDGLQLIQNLTSVGGDKAEAALKAIDAIVQSLQDGFDGTTTPDVVATELDVLRTRLAQNDEAALARLRERFDTSTTD